MSTGFWFALLLGVVLGSGVGFVVGWVARGRRRTWVA